MDHCEKTTRKPNPKDKAHFLSLLTFSYTAGIFKKGIKRDLDEDDIYQVIKPCRSKENGDRFEKKWQSEVQQGRRPNLLLLFFRCFGLRYFLLGAVRLTSKIVFSVIEPLAIGKLVSYFNPLQTSLTYYDALYYTALLITAKLFNIFVFQNYVLLLQQLAIQIRASLCSLVYRKALRIIKKAMERHKTTEISCLVALTTLEIMLLSLMILIFWQICFDYVYSCVKIEAVFFAQLVFYKSKNARSQLRLTPQAMNEISLGNIITVITKDVLVFEQSIWMFNDCWMELVRLTVVGYLIYNKMGTASFLGMSVLLSVVPIQAYIGKCVKNLRLELTHKTDQRLQATQETLSAIKIIKMYTWEKVFARKVEEKRKQEMKFLMKSVYLRSIGVISGLFTTKLSFYALIIAYIYVNDTVNAEVIFYVMNCFKDLRSTVGYIIPIGFGRGAALIAASKRIYKVLNSEELEETSYESCEKPKVKLSNVTITIKNKDILKNISVDIQPGLTVVSGPLGSGKSSLLKCFLNDYTVTDGKILTEGKFSYSSQDPWLFPSSIKQNILFGEPYDEKRYNEVVKVCALQYDFDLFDRGDETIVSDRGMNLSGGQQARINLARAVYKKSDIYLLDDPLHALDPTVQDYIYQNCIKGFLKDEHCVMVTHNLKHKNDANRLTLLHDGEVVYDGKPQEVKIDLLKEIEEEEELEQHKDKEFESDNEEEIINEDTKLIKRESFSKKKVYSEVKKEGNVDFQVYKKYFLFGGGFLLFIVISFLYISAEFSEVYSTRLLTDWINLQQNISNIVTMNNSHAVQSLESANLVKNFATYNFTENITDYPIEFNESKTLNLDFNKRVDMEMMKNSTLQSISELRAEALWVLKLYTGILLASVFVDLTKQFLVVNFARKASINLHNTMIEKLSAAYMNFYDNYFIGNILNRFSQDLNTIDELLPESINVLIEVTLATWGIAILVSTVSWTFIIPSIIFVVLLFWVRTIYLPTGRSLKRLESATRSPLIGHLNASMEGVTTIRASKAQKILEEEFDRHQDLYTSALFMSLSTRRAFGFSTDVFSVAFVGFVCAKFLFWNTDAVSGDVGLAITKASALANVVQWALIVWAELENNMTSVERVLEYTEVPQENYKGQVIEDWPTHGRIVYKNVSLAYKDEKVLKNLCFEAKEKQKIGIVGRTGAGKSSIISTLFRLYNFEGGIFIDGVDTKTLELDYFRDRISIIPQEPLLFQGTIRQNIDPLKKYSDEEIWNTLEKVHMKDHINTLDLLITDHGSNFSTGQRQLISLARAIIKKNKIVVLDEATSNMDPETDALAQRVIDEQFCECTVFIIAHRLQSVLNCNKIMVMEKGEIVEFDDPLVLIENKNSYFAKMLVADNAHHLSSDK